ncbi:hypothetical protein GGR50DRAFT_622291 [Xylaria sp. CBS 124048]|nr:hypothetical protein GGR50DRAFT_622291 [Xylaria sp. CBS 124048]
MADLGLIAMPADRSPTEEEQRKLDSCARQVRLVFLDHVEDAHINQLSWHYKFDADAVIHHIVDEMEQGLHPSDDPPKRKRKRDDDDDNGEGDECKLESVRAIKRKISTNDYFHNIILDPAYAYIARTLISHDFRFAPLHFINHLLLDHGSLFACYMIMDDATRQSRRGVRLPWEEKKTMTRITATFAPRTISKANLSERGPVERAAIYEYMAAQDFREFKDAEDRAEDIMFMAAAEERKYSIEAICGFETVECQICFEEFALDDMIRCAGEISHWFCQMCMKRQVESQIGMGKYELTCMSQDGCEAGFTRAQKSLFLDKKTSIALDRMEQATVLRMAGIKDLETCPFCPYAAEYPDVSINKEFYCANPRCEQVSCRLCRRATHIPRTCEENAARLGIRNRIVVEEAMSAARIRRCNNCKNPYVKQDGCNKVRCTICQTLQCDFCRETIADYSHFDDIRRGGKNGQCPLFDRSEERYIREVEAAEEEIRQKIAADLKMAEGGPNAQDQVIDGSSLLGPLPPGPGQQGL